MYLTQLTIANLFCLLDWCVRIPSSYLQHVVSETSLLKMAFRALHHVLKGVRPRGNITTMLTSASGDFDSSVGREMSTPEALSESAGYSSLESHQSGIVT